METPRLEHLNIDALHRFGIVRQFVLQDRIEAQLRAQQEREPSPTLKPQTEDKGRVIDLAA